MHHVRIVFILLISLLWGVPAYAGTVGIVQRTNPTPALFEAQSRIHGELLSVGLEVKQIERPAERDASEAASRAWLDQIASEGHIDAVIEIIGDMTPTAAQVWVIEKTPRRLTGSRITLEPNTRNAAETLAIRAVEVLRSTFLERDMAAREHNERPPARVGKTQSPTNTPPPVAQEPPERSSPQNPLENAGRLRAELGAAVLTGLDGVGPAIMPLTRMNFGVRPWLEMQATLAGFGTSPTVSGNDGSARIAQKYGVLGGCFGLPMKGPLRPFLALSAGVLHTSIQGHAQVPRQGHDAARWSLLVDAGLGTQLWLAERLYLSISASAQIAEPYVAIHITDTVAATSGHPNLASTLTAGMWL